MTRRQTPEPEPWLPVDEDASFFGLEQDAIEKQKRQDSAEKFANFATNWLLGTLVVLLIAATGVLGAKGLIWLATL